MPPMRASSRIVGGGTQQIRKWCATSLHPWVSVPCARSASTPQLQRARTSAQAKRAESTPSTAESRKSRGDSARFRLCRLSSAAGSWGVEALARARTRPGWERSCTPLSYLLGAPPTMRLGSGIGGSGDYSVGRSVRLTHWKRCCPEIERRGIATAEEVAIETLAERVTQEAIALASVISRTIRSGG